MTNRTSKKSKGVQLLLIEPYNHIRRLNLNGDRKCICKLWSNLLSIPNKNQQYYWLNNLNLLF